MVYDRFGIKGLDDYRALDVSGVPAEELQDLFARSVSDAPILCLRELRDSRCRSGTPTPPNPRLDPAPF